MSTRSRAQPWFWPRRQVNDWGELTTLDEARARISVQVDGQEEAGFVRMFGPVIVVDPRSLPHCPPGDWKVCFSCDCAGPRSDMASVLSALNHGPAQLICEACLSPRLVRPRVRRGVAVMLASAAVRIGDMVMARPDGSVAPVSGASAIAIGYATSVETTMVDGVLEHRAEVVIAPV